MRTLLTLALGTLAAAATLAAPAAGKAGAPAAHAAQDWTTVFAVSPEGGLRMGNPSAPLKLVEYGSLTCSHCATFARDGVPSLVANYVRTGKASYEYRSLVLNGIDVTAVLVARCAGPREFFAIAETLYASQPQWIGKGGALPQAEKDAIDAMPVSERLVRMGEVLGLVEVAGHHGVAPEQARQCLADPASLERLGEIYDAAEGLGVQGTPTFFLNGSNIGSHTWQTLEPILQRAAAH